MKSPHSTLRYTLSLALLATGGLAARGADTFPSADQLPVRAGLPDPLLKADGTRISTARDWEAHRQELKARFAHYMYGTMPPAPSPLKFQLRALDTNYFGGKAIKKQVDIWLGPAGAPKLDLLLILPRQQRPAPAFVGLNFCGNQAALQDPSIPLPTSWMSKSCAGCPDGRATEASRGTQTNVWAIEQAIDRGYAMALFYNGDVEPDRPEATEGVRAYYARSEKAYDWGAIAAWAWGMQRAVDYLVTDGDIDPQRIAAVGHSRNGKAALLAAAFDERIALAIPLQAGCGGTAPSRGKIGESVKQINDRFPHWFNARFKTFNDQPDRLPMDQHELLALCAPRPVLFPNAVEDTWANPAGQFQAMKAAEPVYRLLGQEGLKAEQMPEPGKLVNSRLGYYIRPGKHSMTAEDWKVFLDFADQHLQGGKR